MSGIKAIISGVSGLFLEDYEKEFIIEHKPWAFILFARNIGAVDDLKALTTSLRELSKRDDVFIFIDQEGGRVQRLRPPLVPNYPAAKALGEIYKKDQNKGIRAAWIMSRLHAFDLMRYGINANCIPVLDVPVAGAHDVIGTRAYSQDPKAVAALGRSAARGLLDGGVLPVMKHIPGHGRAFSDTHLELARVDASLDILEQSDFVPFKNLSDLPAAMTAHIVYEAIDDKLPATLSKRVIENVIRKKIGFDGLLMSDDLSMKALSGSKLSKNLSDLTSKIFSAGCDIVLHCHGKQQEMHLVANAAPFLEGKALERVCDICFKVTKPDHSDEDALREEFSNLVALV
ncbi:MULTISPECIES: beta-N-acetylhexosaminidase [unclassified Bartonella]|uniref:beta-N-acetylhexosaminidase n=1 Tax=unclassified Bartonella TaxID=2645622 RepID=UPI0009998DF0|nr:MULTISPECIES: beta-N-acetylhexosaminidase [unclassified Bartonella]AQX28292.1 beta-N-acetylhexosaminidase [Bartonella sp. JB15]AQX29563.1 beta-N-acetylhexosaminidase [Bartonella sp. JB63]